MLLSEGSISKKRLKIEINGIVQGVGFRPFVYKLALKYSLCGYILNAGKGVEIEIEGDEVQVDKFLTSISSNPPPLARIDTIHTTKIPIKGSKEFSIIQSLHTELKTMVSPDISMCPDCKKEMNDPSNRRYKYPFINCTNCGPRYTIIDSLPYDRKNTSMRKFKMCEKCKAEYEDPTNRRYHAQPISCYECGPKLEFISLIDSSYAKESEAIDRICDYIKAGKIVAVKGLGGFHIVCDATNEKSIEILRKKKHRPTKPLAVMFSDIAEIKKMCIINEKEESLIVSKERPIVLVTKKEDSKIAKNVAPNIDKIGVFLPYTPLHELILEKVNAPIVATSANISNQPIIRDKDELFQKLSLVIDAVLSNDREIINACDDSVVMSVEDRAVTLRCSRGYAPKSFFVSKKASKKVLAVGANQKSTITLAFENNLILSPHIGDLNSIDAFEYFIRTLDTFKRFYNFEPDIIVCDKHPGYETTKWAKAYVQQNRDIELIEVQHHYAHALSCMAEYNLDGEALAFCFDGTGYGDDGTIWGGEVLFVTPKSYKRVYHLKEFPLIGGEKAVKEPRRVALSLLFEYFSKDEISNMDNALINSFSKKEFDNFYLMYKKGINSPKCSSMGRLFDGVYALCGYLNPLGYEGESGLILETIAQKYHTSQSYSFVIDNNKIDIKEMLIEILKEKDKNIIASKFINTVAKIVVDISKKYPKLPVILSGGVFQNKVLLQKVIQDFKKSNIKYYLSTKIPVNDGGISLGQAYYALYRH